MGAATRSTKYCYRNSIPVGKSNGWFHGRFFSGSAVIPALRYTWLEDRYLTHLLAHLLNCSLTISSQALFLVGVTLID